jgi:hypothetical protein
MRTRNLLIAIGLAVLTIVLLSLMGGGRQQAVATYERSTWSTLELTRTVYLPLVGRAYIPNYISPFGIVMYGNVNDAAGLQRMKDAGSKWVTTALNWAAIEQSQGSYDWSSFDSKVQNTQAAGMDVFVLFKRNPSWAALLPGGPVTSTQDLVNFVTLMAERYDCDGVSDALGSPCVHYWSFYGEPDNGDLERAQAGKGYWGHNGAGYAAMLSQISPAIHGANPQAKVLIGGLAYDWFEEEGGPFVRSFLTDTLAALNTYPGGASAYIDAVAFHSYPISIARWPTIREKTLEVRGIMERHGVGDLPLICPETGYWSAEEGGSSEVIQAYHLVRLYVRGLSVGLEHMSWLAVFDARPEYGFTGEWGLFPYQDLEHPKLSYYAYQNLTQELTWARYLRSVQAAGAEGYVFLMPDGREKSVLWATTASTTVSFSHSCLRLVDAIGNVYDPIYDGNAIWDLDGPGNGQITLRIYQDAPVYVIFCD